MTAARHTVKLRAASFLSETVAALTFSWPGPLPRAGQFFMVKPVRSAVFLARPLSAADFGEDWVSFLVVLRGAGTGELLSLPTGEAAELTGPLGNGWDAPRGFAALVAGGAGAAPVAALARSLPDGSYDFYGGFRSRPFGISRVSPRRLVIASEDGSAGTRGRILDFLDVARYEAVYACGPDSMLKALARSCGHAGVRCAVSMEKRMACGVGACLGCAVRTSRGSRRCCADGPVFNAAEVDFDA
ncbi:MAG: dihydroorotate dehydrogenase electron transfer subunit [Spirochaetaceae bacterium]|jgi:NAD(P)H-flavin reductase|nr:dihydroorotate dehydrogenase electron transfer subunit [Spirochaetaceae bacterium]